MKYQVIITIGKLQKVKEFEDFKLASAEFETLKRMKAKAVIKADGKDISDTFVEKAETIAKAEAKVIASTTENKILFVWKEGEAKKTTTVNQTRAKVLLERARKAGFPAYMLNENKQLIDKVNC